MGRNDTDDDKSESRLYVGNLDYRITESNIIKMFSPFGKILSEDFLWHTRGPKRGEPRGYAFIQYTTEEEARLAKAKMNARLVFGRPLVVRLASEKHSADSSDPVKASTDPKQASISSGKASQTSGKASQISRSTKIAAIKNKLKSLEEEGCSLKKPRIQTENFADGGGHGHSAKRS